MAGIIINTPVLIPGNYHKIFTDIMICLRFFSGSNVSLCHSSLDTFFFLFGRFACFHFIWNFTVSPRFFKKNRWKVSARASTCSFSASGNSTGYENGIHSKDKDNLWPCSYWFQGSVLPLCLLFTNSFLVYFMFEISEPR